MQITRIGDGLAVVLTPELVERLGLKEGDEVEVLPVAKPSRRSQAEIDGALEMLKGLRKYRGSLPADFKFDREWANSRGRDDED